MSDTQESPTLEDLTPEEANRIIHSHRKVRYGKWISVPECPEARSPARAPGPSGLPSDTIRGLVSGVGLRRANQ